MRSSLLTLYKTIKKKTKTKTNVTKIKISKTTFKIHSHFERFSSHFYFDFEDAIILIENCTT